MSLLTKIFGTGHYKAPERLLKEKPELEVYVKRTGSAMQLSLLDKERAYMVIDLPEHFVQLLLKEYTSAVFNAMGFNVAVSFEMLKAMLTEIHKEWYTTKDEPDDYPSRPQLDGDRLELPEGRLVGQTLRAEPQPGGWGWHDNAIPQAPGGIAAQAPAVLPADRPRRPPRRPTVDEVTRARLDEILRAAAGAGGLRVPDPDDQPGP